MPNPIKIRAVVEAVAPFGEGVYSVNLRPSGRVPRFKAGQFLHLTVDEYDPAGGYWPDSRVFSIASSSDNETISLVYSVKGAYTKKMESVLKPGFPVWIKLPYGDFIVSANIREGQDAVLIAGGTGVSPFIPYLESLRTGSSEARIRLFYGIRRIPNFLFRSSIERCAEAIPEFKSFIFVEDEDCNGLDLRHSLPRNGRLSVEAIAGETTDLVNPVYFLSGPPAMIKTFKEQLVLRGVDMGNIKIDEWE